MGFWSQAAVLFFLSFTGPVMAADVVAEIAEKVATEEFPVPLEPLKKALKYLFDHSKTFKNQNYLTLVNMGQPSTERRLYLVNLKTGEVKRYYVSHGRNSRDDEDKTRATKFSNRMNSRQTSLGFYRTLDRDESVKITNGRGETYHSTGIYTTGAHGKSLRLQGLQRTNRQALNREIVIHGAEYVSTKSIELLGRLGESSGCPAMHEDVVDEFIDLIEGSSLYYIFNLPPKPTDQ